MAALFGITGWALVGPTGLAILVGGSFLLFVFVSRRELQIDTSAAREIGPGDHTSARAILDELSQKAGVEPAPELYLIDAAEMNAATMGKESRPIMAVTSSVLTELSDRELRAILAHEVTHLTQHDLPFFRLVMMLQLLTMSVARVGWLMLILFWPLALMGGARIPLSVVGLLLAAPVASIMLQAALSRSREYAADLGAVELTGDPEGLAMALRKIDRRQQQLWRQVLPVPRQKRDRSSVLRTHPGQEERIERLEKLAGVREP